jgi:predicted dehydrogenase
MKVKLSAPPLRIGVIGVGTLSLRGILPHLSQADVADRVSLAALCDPAVGRAQEAAARYRVPHVFGSLEGMLQGDTVDIVTVVSPIGLHFQHCRLALEAGKHVHVNKTMTTTVVEADALIELAATRGLRIVASPGEVLRPQVARMRELLAEGAIGIPVWASCGVSFGSYHENEPERDAAGAAPIDPSWYYRRPGGGPMYDITSYALHQLTAVLGPARRVTAMSGIRVPKHLFNGREIATEMDDNTFLLLDFGKALFGLAFGAAGGASNPQFAAPTIFGTSGTLDGILLDGAPIDFPGRAETLGAPITDWEHQMRVLPHVTGAHRDIPESHVFEDIMQLVRWVREGVPSAATAEHARHVIEIIEKGYASAETGRAMDLATTFDWPS